MGLPEILRTRKQGLTFIGSLLLVTVLSLGKNSISAQKIDTSSSSKSDDSNSHLSIKHNETTHVSTSKSSQQLTSLVSSTKANTQSTSLVINGQSINVPKNGSIHKTISNISGQTNVRISISDNGSANNTYSSSSSVNIDSNSQNDLNGSVSEEHVFVSSP